MKKRFVMMLAALLGVCCLGGCGSATTGANATSEVVKEESKASETAESQTPAGEQTEKEADKAIMVVSFGTSYNDSRVFTSQIIIDVLSERDKLEIDNVEQALDRAVSDGVKELIVQPPTFDERI